MSRYSYKDVERIINNWNSNHPEVRVSLRVFDGYYHIGYQGPDGSVRWYFIVQSGPTRTFEVFQVWKEGYCAGLENA